MTLDKLAVGQAARITRVGGEGALRRRLLDMGLTPGTAVELVKRAPLGDPVELELRGYSLTLRLEDAAGIQIDGPQAGDNGSKSGKGGAETERGA